MTQIFLALGSNVGHKKQYIHKAVKLLGEKISNITVAKLYETKPQYFADQDIFINTVLQGETDLSPVELLVFVKFLEKKIGRITRFQNGPREIDIDILFYDALVYESVDLKIPHPRIQEREFILKPFQDIAPDFVHPVLKKTMRELYKEIIL